MTAAPQPGAEELGSDRVVFSRGQAGNLPASFFDFRFRTMSTIRLAPALYVLAMALSALTCVYLAVLAFRRSVPDGLTWAILICPAIFIASVVLVRIVIEFVLAILILMVRLEETTDAVLMIVNNTTDISAQTFGLPTLPSLTRGLRALRGGAEGGARRAARQAAERVAASTEAAQAADLAVERAIQESADRAVRQALDQAAARAAQRALREAALAAEATDTGQVDP